MKFPPDQVCNRSQCSHGESRRDTFYHHCSHNDCQNYIKTCEIHSHSGVCNMIP